MNGVSRTSRSASLAAWPAAVILLVAGTGMIVADRSPIRNPWDVAVLVVLSLSAFITDDFSLPAFRLDVGLILAFAAVILSGPFGCLIVVIIPELIRPLVERHPVRRIATVTNLASFAWAVLAAELVLLALPTAHDAVAVRWLTYSLAATAMATANFVIVRGVLAGLLDQVLIANWRAELRGFAAYVALAPIAAVAACLIPVLGILALIAAAVAEAFLSVLVRLVTWTPRAGGLSIPEARSRYATAIASRMSLSRSERRVLLAAARADTGWTAVWLAPEERDRVAKTLILAGLRSRWDSGKDDCFSRLEPAEMGIESRVLLVAHGWAERTAMGTEQLEHRLALLTLHNNQRRYDRGIVAIARGLITDADGGTRRARVPQTRELRRRIEQLKLAS